MLADKPCTLRTRAHLLYWQVPEMPCAGAVELSCVMKRGHAQQQRYGNTVFHKVGALVPQVWGIAHVCQVQLSRWCACRTEA